MIPEYSEKHCNEANRSQYDDRVDEKLTPELMSCPSFQQQICDIVFTLIPEVPRLKGLFLSWEALNIEEKALVEHYGKINSADLYLYKPILEAMGYWDRVQDTQGAPGCDPGMVSLSGQPQIETALTKAVYTLECLVSKLHEDSSNDHLGHNSVSILTGAPGCDPGMVSLSGQPQIETALTKAVYTLECLVSKLHEDSSSDHLGHNSVSRLSSSLRSVYDEENDRGDNGDSTEHSSLVRKAMSLDDIPKLLAKQASVFSL